MGILDILAPGHKTAGNMINSFFHPEKGYEKAGQQMQQFYKDAQGNLQPIVNQGQDQYGRLMDQASALNDPAALESQWANNYAESPYAQQMTNKATQQGLEAASSMGLMGSSGALNNIQQSAGDIMQSDRQAYMDDLMKKYMASIGIGQDIYGAGATASGQQSQNAMNQGQNMGQVAFNQTNVPGEMFGKLVGPLADIGINYATGGVSGTAKGASNMPKYAQNSLYGNS